MNTHAHTHTSLAMVRVTSLSWLLTSPKCTGATQKHCLTVHIHTLSFNASRPPWTRNWRGIVQKSGEGNRSQSLKLRLFYSSSFYRCLLYTCAALLLAWGFKKKSPLETQNLMKIPLVAWSDYWRCAVLEKHTWLIIAQFYFQGLKRKGKNNPSLSIWQHLLHLGRCYNQRKMCFCLAVTAKITDCWVALVISAVCSSAGRHIPPSLCVFVHWTVTHQASPSLHVRVCVCVALWPVFALV